MTITVPPLKYEKKPWFFRRLMEIKEEQLYLELQRTYEITKIHNKLIQILEELKGGRKDGKNKNKRN